MPMPKPEIAAPSLVTTITWRIAIVSLLAVVMQLAITIISNYFDDTSLMADYVEHQAQLLLRNVESKPSGFTVKPLDAGSIYTGSTARSYAFRIFGQDGQTLAEHNGALLSTLSPWQPRPSRSQDLWLHNIDPARKMHVAGGHRFHVGDADVWIEVATLGDPERQYLSIFSGEVFEDVWLPMIPLIVLTLGVAIVSVRRSLEPLTRAAQLADQLSPADRGERMDTADLPQEAASLVSAINRWVDKAHSLVESQRMFVARAAHELRTPLAILMLEVGRSEEPRIRRLQADVRAMSETVDRLLVLARLERSGVSTTDAIDIGALAADLIDRMDVVASTTGHEISLQVNEPACAVGDRIAILESLRNLIENALRHTPSGTRVQVTVGPGGAMVVEDSGPGIGDENVADIVLPFRKGRGSGEGSGLGLAIVRQAADLHGGTLGVSRSALGGARFELVFSAAHPETVHSRGSPS
jgi:two-component system sensor histidine kinase QseC